MSQIVTSSLAILFEVTDYDLKLLLINKFKKF
ncbi:MAG: hypothetical protein JWQ66_1669 [Mucilaginibacter sp.]|nr:hypothetical protein [Mucilaginibacter sp.]